AYSPENVSSTIPAVKTRVTRTAKAQSHHSRPSIWRTSATPRLRPWKNSEFMRSKHSNPLKLRLKITEVTCAFVWNCSQNQKTGGNGESQQSGTLFRKGCTRNYLQK